MILVDVRLNVRDDLIVVLAFDGLPARAVNGLHLRSSRLDTKETLFPDHPKNTPARAVTQGGSPPDRRARAPAPRPRRSSRRPRAPARSPGARPRSRPRGHR